MSSKKSIFPQVLMVSLIGIALPVGAYLGFYVPQEQALDSAKVGRSKAEDGKVDIEKRMKSFEADRAQALEMQKIRGELEASFLPVDSALAEKEVMLVGLNARKLASRLCLNKGVRMDDKASHKVEEEKKFERAYKILTVQIATTSAIAAEVADFIERQRPRNERDMDDATGPVYYCSGVAMDTSSKGTDVHQWTFRYIFPMQVAMETVP